MATNGLTPTQIGVNIIQQIVQLGMEGASYERSLNDLHGVMSDYAMAECRANGMSADLTLEQVTSDEMDASPEAEAYWRQTSAFFRKVFQACAAAA